VGKIYEFDVGGKSKKVKGENVFVVKDDILLAEDKVIPLWLLAF